VARLAAQAQDRHRQEKAVAGQWNPHSRRRRSAAGGTVARPARRVDATGAELSIIRSDQRSFALLAARFPQPPAGEMFLSLAEGERHALGLLFGFAAALGWGETELLAYEPRPFAQARSPTASTEYVAHCQKSSACQ
jgi:hypothetical protein